MKSPEEIQEEIEKLIMIEDLGGLPTPLIEIGVKAQVVALGWVLDKSQKPSETIKELYTILGGGL